MEQLQEAAKAIRTYRGSMEILCDPCASQLPSLVMKKVFINTNRGIYRGCGAGRTRIALNASGQLQPCRFMPFPEDCTSVSEYWENSALLQKLRRTEEERSAPCSTCLLRMNCLPCAAACIQADELTEAPQGCTISG